MKIICIYNGLGNQMSQYAFYLSQQNNQKVLYSTYYTRRRVKEHNGYELFKLFNIPEQRYFIFDLLVRIARKLVIFKETQRFNKFFLPIQKILNIIGIKIIRDKDSRFNKNDLLPCRGINIYIYGWFSAKYFKEKENIIKYTFRFDTSRLSNFSLKYLEKIKSENSISIHIRRGDYLSEYWSNALANQCTLNYYYKAIEYITGKIINPVFYIFSDDISWVKENLNICNPTYVEHNTGENSWQDMYLMSQCKHHIVANSTFSWWGAWLGDNKNKIIIAPHKYSAIMETPEFFPEEWIKIDSMGNYVETK